jgi:hypothetical protein
MDWREARLGGGVGPGWEPLVDELHAKLLTHDPDVVVTQVKEKFGGLRYYYRSTLDHHVLDPIVHEYERKAARTCEWCGAPAETTAPQMGWLKTLCPEHTEAWARGERWWDDGR